MYIWKHLMSQCTALLDNVTQKMLNQIQIFHHMMLRHFDRAHHSASPPCIKHATSLKMNEKGCVFSTQSGHDFSLSLPLLCQGC